MFCDVLLVLALFWFREVDLQEVVELPPVIYPLSRQRTCPTNGGNLSCYACFLDFSRRNPYERNHPCLGKHVPLDSDYLVNCGPKDRFCRVEVTEVNGVLTELRRECSEVCYYGCRVRGFGISTQKCAICCTGKGCNSVYPEAPNSVEIPVPKVHFSSLFTLLAFVLAETVSSA